MVSMDEHKRSLLEFLNDIEEKVSGGLVLERQRLIGFSASEASCDLFAILLHKKNLITPGFHINHRFFASEKIANSKFGFDFPQKNNIILLLVRQEEYRSLLCYGRAKDAEKVNDAIRNLYKIKGIVESLLGETL